MPHSSPRSRRASRLLTTTIAALATLVSAGTNAAQTGYPSPAGTNWSLSPASAPPVTVADLIGMATIDAYDIVSPDGGRVAMVVHRGNLARNTVDYALVVFRTVDLFHAPKGDTVATMATATNDPAISGVRWLGDNGTLAFLGQQPGTTPQVYTVDIRARTVTQRTHAATPIRVFDVAPAGEPVVYAAEAALDTSHYAAMRAHGFVVGPNAWVGDLIAGDWLPDLSVWLKLPNELHVVRSTGEHAVPFPSDALDYKATKECDRGSPIVAPDGQSALMKCKPHVTPAGWSAYRPDPSWDTEYSQYYVIDLTSGTAHPLPVPLGAFTTVAWSPDNRSVMVGNALLPLTGPDSVRRAKLHAVAEIELATGAVTPVILRDSLHVLSWDARTGVVEVAHGQFSPDDRQPHEYFRKTGTQWAAVSARSVQRPTLVIDQGMNAPPRLMVVDPVRQTKHLVYDPNPGLLAAHRFGRKELLEWTTKAGDKWGAGVYYPPDYVPGRRYPFVIQTHGDDSTLFLPNGPGFPTGLAAAPLAAAGIVVLQVGIAYPVKDGHSSDYYATVAMSVREVQIQQEAMEAAIDELDKRGIIDRTKVGMVGFSRSCWYVLYFLTHSGYPLAAASVNDGVDKGYLQDLTWGGGFAASEAHKEYNGGPWGEGLRTTWLKEAPGFNLDKVTAPLLLTAITPRDLLNEWEPYAGLLLQGKPAEMVLIPEGVHVLFKPWDRMTSQQGAVDWYRFWLQGYEDSDPAKAEQYTRWHRLRASMSS